VTSEKDTLSMLVTLHADENPELFKRLAAITNKQRRSRELKKLATDGLVGFTLSPSPESVIAKESFQGKRLERNQKMNSSQTNISQPPSDALLLPITDSLEGLSM
jgi:hypothetical protein